jgi:hypothetical protein
MINKTQISVAVVTIALMYDMNVTRRNKNKLVKVAKHTKKLLALNDIQELQIHYLVDMITRHDIELTDFDRIALEAISKV